MVTKQALKLTFTYYFLPIDGGGPTLTRTPYPKASEIEVRVGYG